MNKLFIINSYNQIEILKKNGINNFVYPLFSFCVGVENEFKINEIKEDNSFIFVNRVLDSKSANELNEILHNLPSNIKGIIFEDLGIIEMLKDVNIIKILYLTHFACNYISANLYLKYVDSIILPHDITESEIDEIISKANKKISLNVFGLIPSMYSRRTLVTNYEKHYNIKVNRPFIIEKEDKKFIILENEYGSYIYKLPYYNALNLLNKDALYYLYFPIFLNDKDLEDLVNNKVNINFDDGFLNKKTIYKVKGTGI